MKGVNVMLSWVIVLVIVVVGITIIITAAKPAIDQARAGVMLTEAENTLNQLNDAILTVRSEGIGSSRIVRIPQGKWKSLPESDELQFTAESDLLEPGTRRITGNLALVSGPEASCFEGSWNAQPAWVMENSYLRGYIQKVSGSLNTARNVLAIE